MEYVIIDIIDVTAYNSTMVFICKRILDTFETNSQMHLYLTCAKAFYHGLFHPELNRHYQQQKNLGRQSLPDLHDLVFFCIIYFNAGSNEVDLVHIKSYFCWPKDI